MNTLFEGTISTKAILEAGKRQAVCLYVDGKKRTRDIAYIIALAKNAGIPVEITTRQFLDDLSGSRSHGGILLEAAPRSIPALTKLKEGFVCYVNGVEDPYNIGSICRTLYAAGCSQLVLDARDWSSSEKIILRASAGAYEKLDIVMIQHDTDLIEAAARQGLPLLCASRKDACALYDYTYPVNFVLAIGGALRGLSARLEAASSQNIYIAYRQDFRNALDSASAVAVFAFEYVRQMRTGQN